MKELADLVSPIVTLILGLSFIGLALYLRKDVLALLQRGGEVGLKVFGTEVSIKPSSITRGAEQQAGELLGPIPDNAPIPADYFFLNHSSRLQEDKQAQFQAVTKVHGVPHYNIYVILDSYYRG